MMSKFINGLCFLAFSFFILSAPINNTTIFEYIDEYTGHYVGKAYEDIFGFFKGRYRATSRYIKKLISNSDPVSTFQNKISQNLEFMDKSKKVFFEQNQNKVHKAADDETDLYNFMVNEESNSETD